MANINNANNNANNNNIHNNNNNNNNNNDNMGSGEWFLTVVDANVIKGFDLFTKSDLYVQIRAGDKTFRTKTCRNSNYPVWNESMSFPMSYGNKDIEIKVLDDDLFKDDKIATANIYYDQLPKNFGEEKDYSIPMAYENKDVGILHLHIKNTPNRQSSCNNNVSNLNQSTLNNNPNNNNPPIVVREEYFEEVETIHPSQNINTNVPLIGNNSDLVATIPAVEINQDQKTKVKKDKKRHHHHHDPKVVLPEKHHHYNDGLTSSSSESSNEGEKIRAEQGKLGSHAYDAPIDNNEPYINNTYPINVNRNDPNPNNVNTVNPNNVNTVDSNNVNYNNQNNLNHNNVN